MKLQLDGKKALVTGSSAGIGEAIAKALADEGVHVMVQGRKEAEVKRVTDEIIKNGKQASSVIGDLSTDDGAQQVVDASLKALGGVDILINNAGVYFERGWNDATPDQWLEIYNLNVVSGVRLITQLVPQMEQRGWGRIIQVASIAGMAPGALFPDYASTKAAMIALTVSLSKALGKTGITVNSVSPGPIRTKSLEALFGSIAESRKWGGEWKQIEKHVVEEMMPTPIGRIGQPEEVASLVAFLASPLAGFITGANIRIDGGIVGAV